MANPTNFPPTSALLTFCFNGDCRLTRLSLDYLPLLWLWGRYLQGHPLLGRAGNISTMSKFWNHFDVLCMLHILATNNPTYNTLQTIVMFGTVEERQGTKCPKEGSSQAWASCGTFSLDHWIFICWKTVCFKLIKSTAIIKKLHVLQL